MKREPSGLSDDLPPVIVIDYGAGNLRSVVRAIESVGYRAKLTDSPKVISEAAALILPGVGAAADTMQNLQDKRLIDPIKEYIAMDRPFLGICMGLQVLMSVSEEGGEHYCLDVFPGRVVRIPEGRPVPHMGWNAVVCHRESPLFDGVPNGSHFYFVHSYHCQFNDSQVVVATSDYGVKITALVHSGNIVATQFHPEKSQRVGLKLLHNFAAL